MQAWADYLAGLKAGGKVVPIKRKKAKPLPIQARPIEQLTYPTPTS